jgi:hypothetical protein
MMIIILYEPLILLLVLLLVDVFGEENNHAIRQPPPLPQKKHFLLSESQRFEAPEVIDLPFLTPNEEPLVESDRILGYQERNYTWPLPDDHFIPNNNKDWIIRNRKRLQQIQQIPNLNQRYEAYIQTLTSSILVSNFTPDGFGLTRYTNVTFMNQLRTMIQGYVHDHYNSNENNIIGRLPYEEYDPIINGPNRPLLIDTQYDLLQQILVELQPYAETWSGIELLPYGAYGFRIYQNQSQLYMHIDRPQTHIISIILHIASSSDVQPWPLYIEDFYGNTHEVTLTSGDILFYESSKLFHGRPKPLNGSWYCSVFVHSSPKYYPIYHWSPYKNMAQEGHYAVPLFWNEEYTIPSNFTHQHLRAATKTKKNQPQQRLIEEEEDILPELVMVESAFKEPTCPNEWCGTMNTIQWGGPGMDHILMTPKQEQLPFFPLVKKDRMPPDTETDVEVDEL